MSDSSLREPTRPHGMWELIDDLADALVLHLEEKRAFFFCSYVPLEPLKAAGYVPLRVLPEDSDSHTGDAYFPPNMCSYVHTVLRWATGEPWNGRRFPPPPRPSDIAVFTNSCNAMARLYDVWKTHVNCPAFLIDLPHHQHEQARRRYARQIRVLTNWLMGISPEPPEFEGIREAYMLYQKVRRGQNELFSLLSARSPSFGFAGSMMERISALMTASCPEDSLEFIRKAKKLLESVPLECPRNPEQPRVLVAGTVGLPTLVQAIEAAGVTVVADDRCTCSRGLRLSNYYHPATPDDWKTEEELYHAIATNYLCSTPCPRTPASPDFTERVCALSKDLGVNGVVLCALKFCDAMLYEIPELRRKLDVPVLSLVVDFAEGITGQIKTRIEAFAEMIRCKHE